MAVVQVPITAGSGTGGNAEFQSTVAGNLRQVIVLGDPSANAGLGKVTNGDPGTTDYGLVVRPVNQTRGNMPVNATMQLAGADVSTTTPVPVAGNVAHAATDSGNPIKIGGVYYASVPTLSDLQRGNLVLTVNGFAKVSLGEALQSIVAGVETDSVLSHAGRRSDSFQFAPVLVHSASAVDLLAATASKSYYVTDLVISTDGGAACDLKIQDSNGTPVIIERIYLPASAATIVISYRTPKVLTSNTKIQALASSGTPNIYVSGAGYVI